MKTDLPQVPPFLASPLREGIRQFYLAPAYPGGASEALSQIPIVLPATQKVVKPVTNGRKKLWNLSHQFHCPIIGICFNVRELRQLLNKELKYPANTSDYTFHTIAVGVCDKRCKVSEKLTDLLDTRHKELIRELNTVKDAHALHSVWEEAVKIGLNIPGTLWAIVTHPACNSQIEAQLHGDVHMLQHQLGARERVEQETLNKLKEQNSALQTGMQLLRESNNRLRSEKALDYRTFTSEINALRLELTAKDHVIEQLESELSRLRDGGDQQPVLSELTFKLERAERLLLRVKAREASLESEVRSLKRQMEGAEAMQAPSIADVNMVEGSLCEQAGCLPPEKLNGKCILCVGGRTGAVEAYRNVVEEQGGRFLHHDGGREENLRRMETALAAADVVICQVGCISHNAYWRVKEVCKRTGKPCMFVKSASLSSFGRVVSEVSKGGLSECARLLSTAQS